MKTKLVDLCRLFSLMSLLLALSGCATRIYLPGNRFVTPEASGRFLGGEFHTGGAGVTHVQVADDMTAVTPNTTPLLVKNSTLAVGGQLGLLPILDFYYSNAFGGATAYGVKVQVLGEPANTAKEGNLSLAIVGAIQAGSQNSSVESSGVSGKSDVSFSGWEGVLSLGYRPAEGLLIYLSPFVSQTKATVKIERSVSGVTTNTTQPDGVGDMKGLSLGLRVGSTVFLTLEGSLTEAVWTRTSPSELKSDKFTDQALGLALGGAW
jgi:hypothetical protein